MSTSEDKISTASGGLTGRQAQVLFLRSIGMTPREIAERLGLSEGSVLKTIKMAIKRIKAKNMVHAVSMSIRQNWI